MDYLVYSLASLPADAALLPPEEQELARKRGNTYVAIRGVLRQELSRRCGEPPAAIHFEYTPHGKPICATQPFNLSHSGDCLCLAFHHRDIGVDVERIRPRNFAALAARFMCDAQLEAFLTRNSPQDEFYACWCAAEALVKHAGDTMWNARAYPFLYQNGHICCQFSPAPTVTLFTPMPGYQGAVAYFPH